jgi:hypothetical protein
MCGRGSAGPRMATPFLLEPPGGLLETALGREYETWVRIHGALSTAGNMLNLTSLLAAMLACSCQSVVRRVEHGHGGVLSLATVALHEGARLPSRYRTRQSRRSQQTLPTVTATDARASIARTRSAGRVVPSP